MLVLKNGKIMTMVSSAFIGDIAVENGKIVAVGEKLDYPEAETRDVSDMTVIPGIVDPHCHIGMWEDGIGFEGADGNECTNPITPELRAIDGINPFDRCFEEACAGGVTTCVTGPGSANVVGGQFVAIKTFGDSVEDMTLRFPLAVKAALGENPKRVYNSKNQTPQTRMATAALFRKALIEAKEYNDKLEKGKEDPDKMPERNMGKEMLARVIRRELPLKIHAHRADDILTAIRICREFNVRYTLDHCTEGYLITDKLIEALNEDCEGIIVGPLLSDRSKVELRNLSFKAPGILEKAGIEYAMMTDHPVTPEQYLPICTAVAVREGASEEGALRAITINAAKITGIADRVGSLEVGKDADIAVFTGHPFDFRSRCVLTIVNGVIAHEE